MSSKQAGKKKKKTQKDLFFPRGNSVIFVHPRADNNLSADSDAEYHEKQYTAVSGLGRAFHHPPRIT